MVTGERRCYTSAPFVLVSSLSVSSGSVCFFLSFFFFCVCVCMGVGVWVWRGEARV